MLLIGTASEEVRQHELLEPRMTEIEQNLDRSRRLEPDAFRNNIVITVIHRGHANIRYRVVSQTRDGSTLHLTYNTSGHRTPSTEYACPLIVSTARDNYSAVAFIENGKLVKTVPVNAANR